SRTSSSSTRGGLPPVGPLRGLHEARREAHGLAARAGAGRSVDRRGLAEPGCVHRFFLAVVLSKGPKADYSAYVDPVVCIVLSVILLRKLLEILKESFADLVDANPFAETANTIEESARQCAERYRLKGVQCARPSTRTCSASTR